MNKTMIAAALAASTASASANSIGHVSYYGHEFAGKRTASGEIFNPGALTAAHRSLPFGTKLQLTNLTNGKTVVVRINDRGPFIRGRVLDVSLGTARMLGFVGAGTAQLRMEALNSSFVPDAPSSASAENAATPGKPLFGETIILEHR